jgi:PAS domain S-box-containing protein
MALLEIRTIIFSYVITNAICLAVMALVWQRNRERFAGLGFWLANFACQLAAIVLVALRGIVPDLFSIVGSNSLAIAGTLLLYMGLERFAGKRTSQVHNYVLLAGFIIVHSYFTFVQPSLLIRTLNLAAGISLLCAQCAWLTIFGLDTDLQPITRGVGYIFLAFTLFSIARISVDLAVDPGNDFFRSGVFEALAVLTNQMLSVILTFGLLLMVNRRLAVELEGDLVRREHMAEALRSSEEKFKRAFHSSPDAILISRLRDGKLIEVNEGFTSLTEYSREEALTSSSLDLQLWVDPQEREAYVRLLQASQRVSEARYDFRTKSGSLRTGLFSGELIRLGDEPHLLIVVQDITERRHAEEELRKLWRAVEQSQVSVVITDTRGCIEYVNPRFCEVTGYTFEEALGQNPRLLRSESTPAEVYKELWETITSGRTWHGEFQNRKKGGELFWESAIISPVSNEQGAITHFVAVKEDITERKRKDEILRHRTSVLAALHHVALDLVNRHRVEEILQTLLVKIGALLDVQQVSIDLIEGEDRLITWAATPGQPLAVGDTVLRGEGGWLSWQAIETGQPAILEDYSAWSRRRELYEGFPLHAIAIIPIPQVDRVIGAINISRSEPDRPFTETEIYVGQQLAQMVALVLDNARLYDRLESELAERKRVEEHFRESQENFQRYFNMSTVGMGVISPDRRWIESNGRLRQMLGYSAEELDNLTWSEITCPDDLEADLALYDQVLRNERDSYKLDKRFICKDGSLLHTTLFVACHRNLDGSVRYFLASLVDITDRKQAEESLLKLAAIEERQRLARDLHDSVNQSIHGLVLFSETLVSILEKNNTDRARQVAGRLQESARQALKETRLMLYELQPSARAQSIDLVRDLETRLATVERRAGIRAQILQEGSLELCPAAWHENLFWITIEALNNALKHAQARNVQIKICSSLQRLELEVKDDGRGFDPDKLHMGGMGLQTMRQRASMIGGELTIHSTPGKGSSVRWSAEVK